MNKFLEDIKQIRYAIIPVLIYFITTKIVFGYTCIFRILFNIECPGCGLTRAFYSLLKGNIRESLHYNYTLPFWLFTIILFIIDRYIKPLKIKPFPTMFIITAVITIIRYILIMVFKIDFF